MINYQNLQDAETFYSKKGFQRIEVPWTVTDYVDDITKPSDRVHYQLVHNKKCLIASGEQGFLYLYLKEYLPLGRFQTTTPCFRDEPYDLFHEKCFMKNELIITDDVSKASLDEIIDCAMSFFKTKLDDGDKYNRLEVVPTADGFDINYKSKGKYPVELGSYGIRECDFLRWIYGTGCAEPRLSKVMKIG